MTKFVIQHKRKKLFFQAILQIISPMGIVGFFLGLIITLDFKQAIFFFLFGVFVAFLSMIFNILNRIQLKFKIKRFSFPQLQLAKFITETLAILTIIGLYVHYKYHYNILSKEHIHLLFLALFASAIVGYFIAIMVLFNRMVGRTVFGKYLLGRYHSPKEVDRIFMFIDLKGSTTIAEQIGHKNFFSLINEILYDISDDIVENDGEIYKYLGDGIIITWSLKKGLQRNNCINLFFDIERRIAKNQKIYFDNYGVKPSFKAGVHVGKVIVGELGDFKSEIAYMGDAVNTSARIQSQCNRNNVTLLISKELLVMLDLNNSFVYEEIDKLRLKGKLTETVLVKVTQL